jgi:hypothetical protein
VVTPFSTLCGFDGAGILKGLIMMNRRNLIIFILIVTCGCSGLAQAKGSLAKRIETALNAEFSGSVDVEDLLLDRSEHVGKVVKVKYSRLYCHISSSSGSGSATLKDNDHSLSLHVTFPDDREARKWIIDMRDDDYYYDNSGSLYVYVEEKALIALGERRKKKSGRYTYAW